MLFCKLRSLTLWCHCLGLGLVGYQTWLATAGAVPVPEDVVQKAEGAAVNGLRLTLAADKTETTIKPNGLDVEPVRLKLSVTNVSDRRIVLDARWLNRYYRYQLFKVIDPDGQAMRHVYFPVAGPPAPAPPLLELKDYPILQPKQSLEFTYSFPAPYFLLNKPGEYRIKSTYHTRQFPPRDFIADTWGGEVSSNELALKVLPARGAVPAPM